MTDLVAQTINLLKEGRQILANQTGYSIGEYENSRGQVCAIGALRKAVYLESAFNIFIDDIDSPQEYKYARHFLEIAAQELHNGYDIYEVNDFYGKEAVLECYDKTIETLEGLQ